MYPYAEAIEVAANGDPYDSDMLCVLPETDSTINLVDAAVRKGEADGYTVISLRQSQGRGGGLDQSTGSARVWASPPGNLYLSRLIRTSLKFPKELEFTMALAGAEVTAALLPHRRVFYKFANDILVEDSKIAGFLLLGYPQEADPPWPINLSVGFNIKTTPPVSALRAGSAVQSLTSLKDHGVDIRLPDFIEKFDSAFAALRQIHTEQGFTAILTRIGFANAAGLVTLHDAQTGFPVRGAYAGFTAPEVGPRVYDNAILLKLPSGEVRKCRFADYRASARIIAPTPNLLTALHA